MLRMIIRMKHKKRPGVTSLLFVLVLGLLITIMVAGLAALTVREQQKTQNTDLGNRARQTAEAGVQAAVQKLSSNPNYEKTTCTDTNNEYAALNANNQSVS